MCYTEYESAAIQGVARALLDVRSWKLFIIDNRLTLPLWLNGEKRARGDHLLRRLAQALHGEVLGLVQRLVLVGPGGELLVRLLSLAQRLSTGFPR